MKRLPLAAAAIVLSLAASHLHAATVAGKVSFISKRGQNPVAAETLLWLEPATRTAARRPGRFQMTTRGKTLLPHVLAIPVGSTVDFPNDDPISHNLFSLSTGNTFDLGLYRKGPGKSYKFDKAGFANVYCNVHPNMSAVVHIMASPYYAFADPTGAYALTDIPAGRYRLVAWNEQGGQSESAIEVTGGGQVSGPLALTLDSRNFRQAGHTDKNGKAYSSIPREY
jgi:hypothetical protein